MEISTHNSDYASFYVSIIIGSLGLIGNAFVCLVMLRYRSVFNSTTNKLIIHQSVVDFLGSFVFLLHLLLVWSPSSEVPVNTFGSLYCKLWWSMWPPYSTLTVSTYNLVAISIERYFATCQPVKHQTCNMYSNRLVKMVVVAAWMGGWFSQSYLLLIVHNIEGVCKVIWPSHTVQVVVGLFIIHSIVVFIPLGVIIFSYAKIILELRKRSRARAGDNNQDARNMLTRANINVIKTLLVVAIFFVICWTPSAVNNALYNLGLMTNFAVPILDAIVVLNLCINPFIYCFTYERFQKQVKEMLCGGCQRNANRVDTINEATRQQVNARGTVKVSAAVSVIGSTDNPAQP